MRYNLKGLYELACETKLAVMGHDGLPFSSLVASDQYYFMHDSAKEPLDFVEFYEKCVPVVAQGDMVAGECEIHEVDGVKWISCTLYVWDQTEDMLKAKLVELFRPHRMKDLYMDKQQEFVEYKFVQDGCPLDAAKKEDWDSMVKAFFEGDEEGANEQFQVWLGMNKG